MFDFETVRKVKLSKCQSLIGCLSRLKLSRSEFKYGTNIFYEILVQKAKINPTRLKFLLFIKFYSKKCKR